MKLYQTKIEFRPIVITLENENEARAFLSIVDQVDGNFFSPECEEGKLLRTISDAFTNQELLIPGGVE